MSYELKGKLVMVEPINSVSDKFKKQEFVVEVTDGTFTELIKLQLVNDKCDMIHGIDTGAELTVKFNLRGRKWEKDGKVMYFNSLDAWKIEQIGAGVTQDTPTASTQTIPGTDLPF